MSCSHATLLPLPPAHRHAAFAAPAPRALPSSRALRTSFLSPRAPPVPVSPAHRSRRLLASRRSAPRAAQQQPTWRDTSTYDLLIPATAPKAIITFHPGLAASISPRRAYASFLPSLSATTSAIIIAHKSQPTTDHLALAREAADDLSLVISRMRRQYGDALPLFGIGHSLGAKVLLLASCDPDARSVYHPTANIFIAFSNPAIRNAVPLPQLDSDDAQRAVQGVSSFLRNLGENMDLSAFGTSVKTPNLDRVASFVDNIGDALKGKEFSPTPEETFALVGSRYPITPNLLLKFMSDSIDDTDLLLPILQARFGSRKILFRLLRGNHVTVMTPDFNDGSFSTLGVDAFEQPVRNAARVVSDELEAAVACVAAFVKLQTDISSPS